MGASVIGNMLAANGVAHTGKKMIAMRWGGRTNRACQDQLIWRIKNIKINLDLMVFIQEIVDLKQRMEYM